MKHFLTRLIGTLSVFIFGLLATLLLTEISLAVFAKSRQVVKNLNNQSDPNDEFVILALGESTTVSVLNVQGDDYSWPATLEELLNEESTLDTQFKVINEGWNGIDSDFILNNLEQNLDQYQPDLVISMMGINDHGVVEYDAVAGIEEHGFLQKFRTFRLVKYLSSNLREKLQESQIDQNLTDCDSEAECIKVARVYFKEDKLTWAVKFWQKALKYNPTNQISLLRLADYYLDQRRFDQASHYISLLEQHHDQNLEVLVSLGEFYQIQNDQARARNYFKRALEKDPQYIPAQVGLICSISRAPDFADQYEKITSELKNNPTKAVEPYVALAETVQYLDRKEEALIWLMQALNLDPQNIEALS